METDYSSRKRMTRLPRLSAAALLAVTAAVLPVAAPSGQQADRVDIHVDAQLARGPFRPVWAWFGNDEPNYATMPGGQQLLSELAAASPVPVHFRTHNLLTSGDGTA